MNSCIYQGRIYHERPNKNRFSYQIFMWCIDLDELEKLYKLKLFGYNRWSIFSFFDRDHFKFLKAKGTAKKIAQEKIRYDARKYDKKNTRDRIKTMIKELKLDFDPGKVYLLTNCRMFGYVFNPVSFYYCFDKDGKLRALFSEVNNTCHDQKMYYTKVNPKNKIHTDTQQKNYYISPFIDYDTDIHWRFNTPGKRIDMEVDSQKKEKILKARLLGSRKEITGWRLFYLLFRYPFMTVLIIVLIHYQALKLALKKVPFNKKKETDKKILSHIKSD
ncbi:MAG: DUF1365 domain-containing protein [Candidatus Woesearchaeota archaeon]